MRWDQSDLNQHLCRLGAFFPVETSGPSFTRRGIVCPSSSSPYLSSKPTTGYLTAKEWEYSDGRCVCVCVCCVSVCVSIWLDIKTKKDKRINLAKATLVELLQVCEKCMKSQYQEHIVTCFPAPFRLPTHQSNGYPQYQIQKRV